MIKIEKTCWSEKPEFVMVVEERGRIAIMNLAWGRLGQRGTSRRQTPEPMYHKGVEPACIRSCSNEELSLILVQSYWVIWLVLSFIGSYTLGFLILKRP